MSETSLIKSENFISSPVRELALSLYRDSLFEEARDVLRGALSSLGPAETCERLSLVTLLAKVERGARNPAEALRVHLENLPLCDACASDRLRSKFRHGLAVTYQSLATPANREEMFDRALVEYAASSYHAERAGLLEDAASTENNIALINAELGRKAAAREHLARARRLARGLDVKTAQIDETEARVILREGGDRGRALELTLSACATARAGRGGAAALVPADAHQGGGGLRAHGSRRLARRGK